jgi:hypothetical protein
MPPKEMGIGKSGWLIFALLRQHRASAFFWFLRWSRLEMCDWLKKLVASSDSPALEALTCFVALANGRLRELIVVTVLTLPFVWHLR